MEYQNFKRFISINNIPLIINGKYCWEIVNDQQCGEIYKITIGECYLAKGGDYYEIFYYTYNKKLIIFTGMSDYDFVGNDVGKIKMQLEFKDAELIVDSLVKAGNLRVYPLYLTTENV